MKLGDLIESLQDHRDYNISIYDKKYENIDIYELFDDESKDVITGWNPDGFIDHSEMEKYYEKDVSSYIILVEEYEGAIELIVFI